MANVYDQTPYHSPLRQKALGGLLIIGFIFFVAVATFATLLAPPILMLFITPFLIAILAFAQKGKSTPMRIITPLVITAAVLMPLWPVYVHLKLGPMPIMTPPRIIFYLLTIFWVYDMVVSPLRRGHFYYGVKHSRWICGLFFTFFAINAFSIVIAAGRAVAAPEFVRQFIIWFLPFCIFLTYVRDKNTFKKMLVAITIGASIAALIGILEFLTQISLVSLLSPIIADDAVWLRISQEAKLRDGIFRAQATHTHPLSLGEYLSFCLPIALTFLVTARKKRLLWGAAALLIFVCIIATNARGAILGTGAGLLLLGSFYLIRMVRMPRFVALKPVFGLASIAMIASTPAIGYGVYHVVTGESGTSAARSSQARIDQIKTAWPKIMKRPIGGYGTGRAAKIIGYWGRTLSVDNYYLSLAVDFGFPGPILFLSLMIVTSTISHRYARVARFRTQALFLGFSAAIITFIVMRMIISQTGNLSFIYPLLGAFAGMSARLDKGFRRAPALLNSRRPI